MLQRIDDESMVRELLLVLLLVVVVFPATRLFMYCAPVATVTSPLVLLVSKFVESTAAVVDGAAGVFG